VAGIVKLDDAGLHLLKSKGKTAWAAFKRKLGSGLLIFAPILMKTLTIVGTAAGGILVLLFTLFKPVFSMFKKKT